MTGNPVLRLSNGDFFDLDLFSQPNITNRLYKFLGNDIGNKNSEAGEAMPVADS